jgi:hypothetical protein
MELPPRMRKLAMDHRGFPVPWFVAWINGTPDFRVIDTPKMGRAIREKRCWTCGEPLGQYKAFIIGPMCAINRVIREPPSHRECAVFSAQACPFLSKPRMRRNEKNLPENYAKAAGFGLQRNPGAVCVWITRTFKPFAPKHGNKGIPFYLGEPLECLWFAHGRKATKTEVIPELMTLAQQEGPNAVAELKRYRPMRRKTSASQSAIK